MLKMLKDMSMFPKGLRYKTMIAFSLMSLIPILVCAWLVITYIFPNISLFFGLTLSNISFILFISIFISLLGLYITREMIDPVIKMADEAKTIAKGDLTKLIDINREDEVGDLSRSLNLMTQKIKENMEELRTYGEKTKTINMEIHKKVVALSGLLQIGHLISSSEALKSTLDFIIQKISDIEDNSAAVLLLVSEETKEYYVSSSCNIEEKKVSGLKFKQSELAAGILAGKLGLKNIVDLPVTVAGKSIGILAVGNNEQGFVFAEEEKELLKVFVKQIAISVENDILVRKSRELSVKDDITGLYNENYVKTRLDEEIKRAVVYQRPCGYLLVDIDDFKDFYAANGEAKSFALLKEMGVILKNSVTEIDRVGRLTEDRFAVILPEKNKRQCVNIAEEIRKKIEAGLGKAARGDKKITASIGVSENPIDGSTVAELMEKAEKLARGAKTLGKNRVSV
ncbi:MAG: diguanylate cyclase [Candidatus Omnitrophota bacterium]|nr:diguanylate cyclase [Candidatus Omnitrophota bacterium]